MSEIKMTFFTYSGLEGSFKACQLIEHAAQSPDVTLLVVRLSFAQLWGNVARSPDYLQDVTGPRLIAGFIRLGAEEV